jgi:tripartite-type tricarboxylate transporter receptor subunit TctC
MKKILTILIAFAVHLTASAEIKLVVPFAPGGAIDSIARHFATYVERTTGETVVVTNVLGAGSQLGTNKMLSTPGRSAMVNSSSFYVNIAYGTFNHDEFKLASTIGESPMLLAVPTSKNLTCEILRTDTRPFFIGSAGKNSITSVPAKFVTDKFKNYTEVPYKGVAEATLDLVAARIDVLFLAAKVDNPRLQIIANSSLNKHEGLPSIKECLGITRPSASQWVLVTSKDASDDFVKHLNKLAQDYVADDATKTLFKDKEIKSTAVGLTATKKQYDEEVKVWNSILK